MSCQAVLVVIFCGLVWCVICQDVEEVEGTIENVQDVSVDINNGDESRQFNKMKKKSKYMSKYLMPLAIGLLTLKALIFPFAFKILLFTSGLSLVMSLSSLVISALVTFSKTQIFSMNRKDFRLDKQDNYAPVDRNIWSELQDLGNTTVYPYRRMDWTRN